MIAIDSFEKFSIFLVRKILITMVIVVIMKLIVIHTVIEMNMFVKTIEMNILVKTIEMNILDKTIEIIILDKKAEINHFLVWIVMKILDVLETLQLHDEQIKMLMTIKIHGNDPLVNKTKWLRNNFFRLFSH